MKKKIPCEKKCLRVIHNRIPGGVWIMGTNACFTVNSGVARDETEDIIMDIVQPFVLTYYT